MRLFIFFLFLTVSVSAQWNPVSPLGIPLLVTAGFGEVRSQHFHSGLDFSTGGKQIPVYAVESGEIYRIRTTAGGYGRAIYIHHPNGISSVYAHLDRFNPELEAFIRKVQSETRRFEQDTLIPPGRWKVEKGQLIAYSGNTGSSTAPHLHFELRDRQTEAVLNPMEYGIPIRDITPPEMRSAVFIPMKGLGRVNQAEALLQTPLVLNKKTRKKGYSPKTKIPVVSGWVGFGFRGGDVIGKSKNLSGVYDIKVEVDSQVIFHSRFDRFSFAETRCVNGYIDYPTRVRSRAVIHRCVVPANNMIGIYKHASNRGYYYFDKNKMYNIRYILQDFAGNTTVQELKVRGAKPEFDLPAKLVSSANAYLVLPAEEQSINTSYFEAEFWKECLFDTALIQLRQRPVNDAFTPEIAFGSMFIPINQPVLIRLMPTGFDAGLRDKLVIVRRTGKKEVSLGGYWVGDWLSANTSEFGDFRVIADTVAPTISFLKPRINHPKSNTSRSNSPSKVTSVENRPPVYPKAQGLARFRITEKLSGIREMHAWLNGEWILLEASEDIGIYEYRFPNDLSPGIYCMRIWVSDGSGNQRELEMEFESVENKTP